METNQLQWHAKTVLVQITKYSKRKMSQEIHEAHKTSEAFHISAIISPTVVHFLTAVVHPVVFTDPLAVYLAVCQHTLPICRSAGILNFPVSCLYLHLLVIRY